MVCCALLVPCCHESARQQLIHCQARSFRIWSTDIAYPIPFFLLLFRYYTADQTTHNSITLLFCESYANQLPLISLVLLLLLLCSRRREKWRLCIPILGPFVFHIFQQDTGLLLNYTKKISCFVPFFLGEGHSHKRAEQSSSLTEPISIKQSMIKMVIHA